MSAPHDQDVPALRRGGFWILGDPLTTLAGTVQRGPMWVEWLAADVVTRAFPLVLVHGGGGQGTDWLLTADGRPGWAVDFAQAGFAVYVVDRPGHGRSPGHPDVLGPPGPAMPLEALTAIFAAPDADHAGWPWGRDPSSPELLQVAASAGSLRADFAGAQDIEAERLAELLRRIGPAVLVTHSAGAPGTWLAASRARDAVRGIAALEPMGPPFAEFQGVGALTSGLTSIPLASDFAGLPIVVFEADASALAGATEATVAFLTEHGAEARTGTFPGVRGAGHAMMLEADSVATAAIVADWAGGLE